MSFTLLQTSARTDQIIPVFFLYSTNHSNRYLVANIPHHKREWVSHLPGDHKLTELEHGGIFTKNDEFLHLVRKELVDV
jgi:hypothetical protein